MSENNERRQSVRTDTALEIIIQSESAPVRGRIGDLSEGGAFVDTAHPFNEAENVDFEFNIPDDAEPVRGRARVIWRQPNVGMGLQFLDLTPEDRERIRFFVASLFFTLPSDD